MFTPESFPNFFRVVPSENAFNLPRLKLLQQFNWTRVGTIYQNEPRYSLVRRQPAHRKHALLVLIDLSNFTRPYFLANKSFIHCEEIPPVMTY